MKVSSPKTKKNHEYCASMVLFFDGLNSNMTSYLVWINHCGFPQEMVHQELSKRQECQERSKKSSQMDGLKICGTGDFWGKDLVLKISSTESLSSDLCDAGEN